jgi:O-acetyl-ADP-ribose deacetylase (regulator of RNase III)
VTSTFFEKRLEVRTGDITRLSVEAIVNAANSTLLGGGGVDGAIHGAGGPAILAACRALRSARFREGLPTGEAVETTAGKLAARFVIHTVGPVWQGGGNREDELLAGCYLKSLELAARLDVHSIAFPAISTGVYGFPRERAARIVWQTLAVYFPSHPEPRSVMLVYFSSDDARVFLGSDAAAP